MTALLCVHIEERRFLLVASWNEVGHGGAVPCLGGCVLLSAEWEHRQECLCHCGAPWCYVQSEVSCWLGAAALRSDFGAGATCATASFAGAALGSGALPSACGCRDGWPGFWPASDRR